MAAIFKRPRAEADLAEIWDYIAEDSESRTDAFIDTIGKKLALLAKKPSIGRTRDELGENMRSFPVGRYVLYFLPVPDGIDVVRVLHGARDLQPAFGSEESEA